MDEILMRYYFTELSMIQEKAMIEALSCYPVSLSVKDLLGLARQWRKNVIKKESLLMKEAALTHREVATIRVLGESLGWPTSDYRLADANQAGENTL